MAYCLCKSTKWANIGCWQQCDHVAAKDISIYSGCIDEFQVSYVPKDSEILGKTSKSNWSQAQRTVRVLPLVAQII